MNLARGKDSAATGRNAQQIAGTGVVKIEEGVEHRGNQNAAPFVRFLESFELKWIRLGAYPLAFVIRLAQVVTQRPARARGPAELLGQLAQQVIRLQTATAVGDLMAQDIGIREMLEQRHDVRERLVERQDVRVAPFTEI